MSEICELAKLWGLHKSEQLEMITRFLSNAFIEEEPPYALSSWLAHDILFGDQAVDILYYPSMATKLNSCNLAITPKFVDAFLKTTKIFKLEILESTETNIRPAIVEVGIVVGHVVEWRDPLQEDVEYLS